jgi:hypothetical protein
LLRRVRRGVRDALGCTGRRIAADLTDQGETMHQNLVDLSFVADAVADIERALETLDARLAELVALTPRQRRHLTKMGNNSEGFCVKALELAQQYPGLMPRDFDHASVMRDLTALEQLRPWRMRIAHLHQRMADTETALGSDLMTAALKIYALLKVAGEREGLDKTKKELAVRFARPSRRGSVAKGVDSPGEA